MRSPREIHRQRHPDRARPVPRRGRVVAPRVQPRCHCGLRFFGEHERHDQVRERIQRPTISRPDRVRHGRQHRRGQPREGHAAPVHDPLSAHEHDHDGRHAQRPETQPLRD